MSRERTRKVKRLAAVKAFQEQQARQVFAASLTEAARLQQVEEACDATHRRHRAHVAALLGEPALDIGRFLLATERGETAAHAFAVAGKRRLEADTVAAGAAAAWNVRRVSAEVTSDRAEDVAREEDHAVDSRHASDLVDLLVARRRS